MRSRCANCLLRVDSLRHACSPPADALRMHAPCSGMARKMEMKSQMTLRCAVLSVLPRPLAHERLGFASAPPPAAALALPIVPVPVSQKSQRLQRWLCAMTGSFGVPNI